MCAIALLFDSTSVICLFIYIGWLLGWLLCYFYGFFFIYSFIHSFTSLTFHQICWNMFHKNDTFMTSQMMWFHRYTILFFAALSLSQSCKVQRECGLCSFLCVSLTLVIFFWYYDWYDSINFMHFFLSLRSWSKIQRHSCIIDQFDYNNVFCL